jgi:hypothetical protein
LGQGFDGHVDPFEGLDTAHEQKYRVGAEADGVSGAALVPGGEKGVVYAGGHYFYPGWVGAVKRNQLVYFFFAVGQDDVGALNDRGFGFHAAGGLTVTGFGFYSSQGVEHRG